MTDKLYFGATPRMNLKKNLMYCTITNKRFVRALVAGIAAILPTVGLAATVTFQQGVGGYSGNVDTYVSATDAGTAFGTAVNVLVDNLTPIAHGLIRFDNIFGPGAGQVPVGATINSATLTVRTFNDGDTVNFHRMLKPWSASDTWNSLVNGISADNVEARTSIDVSFTGAVPVPRVDAIDVTAAVQSWANGSVTNNGWAVLPTANNGWQIDSAEAATTANRPLLTISFSTPGDPIVIVTQPQDLTVPTGSPATFTVSVTGSTPRYQWFRAGLPLLNATNNFYQIGSVQNSDAGNYFVIVSNSVNSVTSRVAVLNVTLAPYNVTLISSSNAWKFRDDGADLGTSWRAVGYDDSSSSWSNGLSVFAHNDNVHPPTEALPPGNTIRTEIRRYVVNPTLVNTHYFRTKFLFTNEPGDVSLIIASNLIDDGAVFYLNGIELNRVAMPAGTVNYGTSASRADEIGTARYDVFTVPVSSLLPGTNVMAVELHQGNSTSSDSVFSMTLTANIPAPSLLTITNQPQDVVVEEVKTARFVVGVSGNGGRYQWYQQGVGAIPGATFNTLTLTNTSTNDSGKMYFVIASNVVNSVTSRVALLTVLQDTNGPTLVSADGTASPTTISVIFSEPVLALTATNILNYKVTNTLGGTVSVTSAVLTDSTNVLLTTSPGRTPNNNYILIVNSVRDLVTARTNLIATNSMIPILQSTIYVPLAGGTWHFWYGDSAGGREPSGNWRALVYDPVANGWAESASAFAYGLDQYPVAIGTAIDQGLPAYYFRETFSFIPASLGSRFVIRHVLDDGAVFYLNGTEVLRTNLPAGIIASNTLASPAVGDATLSDEIDLPFNLLQPGVNAIVAELHESNVDNLNDSDIVFAAELKVISQSLLIGPAIITSQPQNQTVPENGQATFCVTVVAVTSAQWQRSNTVSGTFTNIPGATNLCYTTPFVDFSYNNALYRVQVFGTNGVAVNSSVARLNVTTETTPPTIVSAFLGSNNTIVISFSEPMGSATATIPANYTVTNSFGVAVTVTSAVLTNATNVVLSFGSTLAGRYTVVINNVTDAAAVPNAILPNSAVTVGANYLLGMENAWKYLQINTNDTVHGEFAGFSYDDSTWSGPSNALLYVENAGLPAAKNTLLTFTAPGGGRINTHYFRQKFLAPAIGANVTFTLRHIIDDGMVLHLNGQEIYRYNMPNGVITAASQANAPAIGDAALVTPFAFTVTNLLAGTNVLAASVHQQGATSSDVVMGVEVAIAIPSVVLPPPPVCTSNCCTSVSRPVRNLTYQRTGTNLVLSWLSTPVATNSCGSNGLYTLQTALYLSNSPSATVWTNVTTVSPYSVAIPPIGVPAPGGSRFYRLKSP
jgi:hypothetical protein